MKFFISSMPRFPGSCPLSYKVTSYTSKRRCVYTGKRCIYYKNRHNRKNMNFHDCRVLKEFLALPTLSSFLY